MPSIKEKAMLASVSIGVWTASKYDKKATQDVMDIHGAIDAGRFSKHLISKSHLDEIQSLVSEARKFHAENTLPWGKKERLLPSDNYMKYTSKMSYFRSEFDRLKQDFIHNYKYMITEARASLGSLYNENDYPSDIADKFYFNVQIWPVQDENDFRVALSDSEVERIKKSVSKEIEERTVAANRNIYARIASHLQRMKERLGNENGRLHDTVMEYAKELSEMLPRMNVTQDPEIDRICQQLGELYMDTDVIRKNPDLRRDAADKANRILQDMESILGPVDQIIKEDREAQKESKMDEAA